MSGTLDIKPKEAKLTRSTELFLKMNPYVKVVLGDKKSKGEICKSGGKSPKWHDTISIHRSFEPVCFIEVKDKDKLTADDIVGVGQIDLRTLEAGNNKAKWYPLFHKQKSAGEILIEINWTPSDIQDVTGEKAVHHTHPHLGNF